MWKPLFLPLLVLRPKKRVWSRKAFALKAKSLPIDQEDCYNIQQKQTTLNTKTENI